MSTERAYLKITHSPKWLEPRGAQRWQELKEPLRPHKPDSDPFLTDEIDGLYRRINDLLHLGSDQPAVQELIAQLRTLQNEAARKMREHIKAQLNEPAEPFESVVQRALDLLGRK